MYKNILVPLDNSNLSISTVGKAVQFASSLEAQLIFFTAQRDYSSTSDGALERAMEPADYAQNAAGPARGILAKAEVAANAAGVFCSSQAVISDRPYEAILDAAERNGCDLIFMSSHGRRGIRDLFVGSETQKVISHSKIPVLVAMVESNLGSLDMENAISIIQSEHRAMAAVTCALKHLVDDACAKRNSSDIPLLKKMLSYIRNIPIVLHHPKEESYLFDRLLKRTNVVDDVIASLQEQHKLEHDLVDDLDASLSSWEKGKDEGLEKFGLAVNRYKDMLYAHIGIEETQVLPKAREHLNDEDWKEIHKAFSSNGDPRFDETVEAKYRKIYSDILNRFDAKR